MPTVTHDATTPFQCGSAGVSTFSFSHTCTGSELLLIVDVGIRQGGSTKSVTSVTYNGVALTKLGIADNATVVRVSRWYLIAPATGSHSVVVNCDAAFISGAARSYTVVDQSTPFNANVDGAGHAYKSTTGSSLAPSNTPASATGELVVDAVAHQNSGSTASVGSGQTSRFNTVTTSTTAANNTVCYGSEEAGAASVAMDWTISGATARSWASITSSLRPGTGGGGGADTTPPQTTITAGPADGSTVIENARSFSFDADEAATFEIRKDGGSWVTATSPYTWSGLTNGAHTFEVRATDTALNVDATPASRSFTVALLTATLDVFLVAGQSNAEGRGSSGSSPNVPTGDGYEWTGSILTEANDPVGGAATGSAWPAFCNAYKAGTGRVAVLVEQATGGTAQAASSDSGSGNWDATGSLRAPAKTAFNGALSGIAALYPNASVNIGGVLWVQGERDSQAIDAASTTKAVYKAAFVAMLAYFRAQIDAGLKVFVSKTGIDDGNVDTAGWQAVRAAQQEVCDADPLTYMAFTGAQAFGQLHYTQAQYNTMGTAMGSFVADLAPDTSMRVGGTAPDGLYYGADVVDAAYLGSTQVFAA